MTRLENPLYLEDLDAIIGASCIDWDALEGRAIAISGATGTVGTVLTDALMRLRAQGASLSVVALGRNEASARTRLPYFDKEYAPAGGFSFEQLDISVPGNTPKSAIDIVCHLASTTHPRAYATQPIATVTSNIIGLSNLAEAAAVREDINTLLFASSVEIYGENRGDVDAFDEGYLGYIDCNTLRAGYPESKRAGEALCQAYASERGIGVSIPRLPRVYGPTMPATDSKAISQFVRSAIAGEDIVLKSEGTQLYSYGYVTDVVCGLLACLTRGARGAAYNVCGAGSDITLRDLAAHLAELGGAQVRFELPDAVERAGYSTATKAILDGSKILRELGYAPRYDVRSGLERTVRILKDLQAS